MKGIVIALLADHPEAIPILARAFETEWQPYYGLEGPGNAESDLRESANRDKLPIAFVALRDGEVCGTAALKQESVSTHRHLYPWLAALLVLPDYRRRGIGRTLIDAVVQRARVMGFEALYSGASPIDDETPMDGLEQADRLSIGSDQGWELIDRSAYFVRDVVVYRKRLA